MAGETGTAGCLPAIPRACRLLSYEVMNDKKRNPSGNVPTQLPQEPLGDRGQRDKTWTPAEGEQGISNRVMDEDPEAETNTDPSKD